jgi:hypothetical protein
MLAKRFPRRVDQHRDPGFREDNLGYSNSSVLGPVGIDHYSIAVSVSNGYFIPFQSTVKLTGKTFFDYCYFT